MNFTKIIKKILDSGLTEQALAKKLKISQPTVNRIKNSKGYTVDYETGMKLIKIRQGLSRRK